MTTNVTAGKLCIKKNELIKTLNQSKKKAPYLQFHWHVILRPSPRYNVVLYAFRQDEFIIIFTGSTCRPHICCSVK